MRPPPRTSARVLVLAVPCRHSVSTQAACSPVIWDSCCFARDGPHKCGLLSATRALLHTRLLLLLGHALVVQSRTLLINMTAG